MAIVTSVLLALLAAAQDEAPIRKSVERSLPYLEKEGLAWIQKRDCLSCHQVTFMLWAHEEARTRGIAVDAKKLSEWNAWSLNESLAQRVRFKLSPPILESLKGEGLAPDVLAKLAYFGTKSGVKEGLKEAGFEKELAKALSPEELSRHKDNLLKHAQREKGDGGGMDTLGQL